MATEGNGDLPVPDLRIMEELCQPSLNGWGGPIALISIQETNFGLKNDMIQQVQNSCQFHGLPGDNANKHLDKFLHVRNEVTNFFQCPDESLFEAWERYKLSIDRFPNHNMLPVTQIDTFYNGLTLRHRDTINDVARGTFMKKRPKECYDLIENMTAHHNDWDTSAQRSESSSSITSSFDTEIAALKAEMVEINKNLMRVLRVNQQVKAVTPKYETCDGPRSFFDSPATVGNTQNVYAAGAYQGNSYQPQGNCNLLSYRSDNYLGPPSFNQNQYRNNQNHNFHNQNRNQGNHHPYGNNQGRNQFFQGANQGNTITIPKEDLKGITTRRGTAYPGPTIPTTSSSPVVKSETGVTNDTMQPTNNGSTEDVQPPVVPTESLILTSEPVNSPIIEPVASPVSASKPNLRPSIPYPSRLQDQKLCEKANDQREKFFQIFTDLNFNISFADALILMPKFDPFIKSLLTNKDKLYFIADPRVPLILGRSFLKTERTLIDVFEGNYLPEGRKELKICEAKYDKSSIDEPPEVELKDLPPHLEYAFLEGDDKLPDIIVKYLKVELKDLPYHLEYAFLEGNDKLPVIIAKELRSEEKAALINVLKSHKRAIAWKLSDIQGINPEFCTYKILMEEDYKPAVQHQRRVNPKIHDVI
nr:reverse transcriptase domain-containing protein [Tanacetum cinerariifolium]